MSRPSINRIDGIGGEIEGLFYSVPENFHSDGSVSIDNHANTDDECGCENYPVCGCYDDGIQGETLSPVFKDVAGSKDQIDSFVKWINESYPAKTNNTCGFHIHFSFKSKLDHGRLTSRGFYKKFITDLENFGRSIGIKEGSAFYRRITGSHYCQHIFRPEQQLESHGDRYTQINFGAWHGHKTLEFRLLPAFQNKYYAVRCAEFIFNYINEYLNHCRKDPKIKDLEVMV